MVLGLLLVSLPVAFGVSEAVINAKNKPPPDDETRMNKFNISIDCDGDSPLSRALNQKTVVLRGGKVSMMPALFYFCSSPTIWQTLNLLYDNSVG